MKNIKKPKQLHILMLYKIRDRLRKYKAFCLKRKLKRSENRKQREEAKQHEDTDNETKRDNS